MHDPEIGTRIKLKGIYLTFLSLRTSKIIETAEINKLPKYDTGF